MYIATRVCLGNLGGFLIITIVRGLALLALADGNQSAIFSFHVWISPTQQRIPMTASPPTPHTHLSKALLDIYLDVRPVQNGQA